MMAVGSSGHGLFCTSSMSETMSAPQNWHFQTNSFSSSPRYDAGSSIEKQWDPGWVSYFE